MTTIEEARLAYERDPSPENLAVYLDAKTNTTTRPMPQQKHDDPPPPPPVEQKRSILPTVRVASHEADALKRIEDKLDLLMTALIRQGTEKYK